VSLRSRTTPKRGSKGDNLSKASRATNNLRQVWRETTEIGTRGTDSGGKIDSGLDIFPGGDIRPVGRGKSIAPEKLGIGDEIRERVIYPRVVISKRVLKDDWGRNNRHEKECGKDHDKGRKASAHQGEKVNVTFRGPSRDKTYRKD